MTLLLDSGALSSLAGDRAKLLELEERGHWPALVPSVVLTEALTGDHRRDFSANRLLQACRVREVQGLVARQAGRLRTATGRAGTITAVDAIVIAMAATEQEPVVLTSDPHDLRALAEHADAPVRVIGC